MLVNLALNAMVSTPAAWSSVGPALSNSLPSEVTRPKASEKPVHDVRPLLWSLHVHVDHDYRHSSTKLLLDWPVIVQTGRQSSMTFLIPVYTVTYISGCMRKY